MKQVVVAVPTLDGNVVGEFLDGAVTAARSPVWHSMLRMAQESDIPRARGMLATMFLELPAFAAADKLFFVDADIEWNRAHLERLAGHDLPIVCGTYPFKGDGGGLVFNGRLGEHPQKPYLLEVERAGTGAMMIRRDVLEDLKHKVERIRWAKEPGYWYRLFPNGIREPRGGMREAGCEMRDTGCGRRDAGGGGRDEVLEYDSEDWGFCRLAREHGYNVWVDRQVQMCHVGRVVYRG